MVEDLAGGMNRFSDVSGFSLPVNGATSAIDLPAIVQLPGVTESEAAFRYYQSRYEWRRDQDRDCCTYNQRLNRSEAPSSRIDGKSRDYQIHGDKDSKGGSRQILETKQQTEPDVSRSVCVS